MWTEANGTRMMSIALGLSLMLGMAGCSDDTGDDGGESPDGGGAAGAGSGGRGGTGGSSGSSGRGSGMSGTGGAPFMMPTCDTGIPTTATCGGTECPMPSDPLAMVGCQVPCCVNDQCGVRNAVMGMTTQCSFPDSSCPSYSGMAMGMQLDLPGCCMAGVCGVISPTRGCVTESPVAVPEIMPGPACGDDDAGVDQDGGF